MVGNEAMVTALASKPEVDGESRVCKEVGGGKEVDQNLKRMQSLLFGADVALENGDFGLVQVMPLTVIGFLDSHSRGWSDEVFIRLIRCEVVSRLVSARRTSIPEFDQYCFSFNYFIE
ncbi:hypothetical protein OROGR_006440 [Orobanche gracilis]